MFDDGFPFWIAAAAAIIVMAILGRRFLGEVALERRIAGTPTSRIRSAAQGIVQVEGKTRLLPGPPIYSPLTLTPCVWYRFTIEKRGGNGNRKRRLVESGVSDDLFALTDGSGTVVVDPDGARLFFAKRSCWTGSTPRPPLVGEPTRTASTHPWAALAMRPVSGLGKQYIYSEELILEHSDCLIYGVLETQRADPDAQRQQTIAQLLAAWKREPPAALASFERDAKGDFTPLAWTRIRAMAARIADHQIVREREARAVDEWHVLSRGKRGTTALPSGQFLIACESEKRILNRLRWHIALGFVAFTAALALSIIAMTPML